MFTNLPERAGRVFSAVPGLPELPSGWRYERLRSVAELRVSGVDKLTAEHEQPVRLCNYTDVYKNDYISDVPGYMAATATDAEIARFRLKKDDVVITKDSESWTDIAVPAYVEYEAADFICAYHLAIIRTRKDQLSGAFLHHALREPRIANQMHIAAGGVTRFGLSQEAIKSAYIPIPPTGEQSAIATYLGHAHKRIDRAILAKRRLIALLEEQKQATFNQAITRGLDPAVPLKDSGTPVLGEVPAHWMMIPARHLFSAVTRRDRDGSEIKLSVTQARGLIPTNEMSESSTQASNFDAFQVCNVDDLVLNKYKAHLGVFWAARLKGLITPNYTVFAPAAGVFTPYYEWLFHTPQYRSIFSSIVYGVTEGMSPLYNNDFNAVHCLTPPIAEQMKIVKFIERVQHEHSALPKRVRREIELLREFRTRLTSDVVTGRADVRQIASMLPELTEATFADYGADDVDSVVEDAEEFLEEVHA